MHINYLCATHHQSDVADSNTAEFEKLFRAEFKGLCFFAYKYVKDTEIAREIVQEAFAALWEKRAEIDYSRNVKSYLSTSIHNKCLNYLRDNRKFNGNILELENLLEWSDKAEPDTSDPFTEKELKRSISNAIDELPEKCREVFILNRYENMKYKDVAEKLGISVKTVEAQMSKALQHLRNRLAVYIRSLILIFLWFRI